MKKKQRKNMCLLLGSLLFPLCMSGQDPSIVRYVNSGKMVVAPNPTGGASMCIPDAMKADGNSAILLNGTARLGGNFYQDAVTPAFTVNTAGWGTSTGKMVFFGDYGVNHLITTSKSYATGAYSRGQNYIAFPTMEINSNDNLVIPGYMGIDAASVIASKNGKLLLQSGKYTINSTNKEMDASLRLSGVATSESGLPKGKIIIERDLSLYRTATSTGTSPEDYPLFAFASPFKSQKSGYFAGNWVRKLLRDNSNYGHVRFVYGNGDLDVPGLIDKAQYVGDPTEAFEVGKGYLVRARPDDYDYTGMKNGGGLSVTGAEASAYNKGKFVFDGKIYNMTPYDEQVFADETLFTQAVNTTLTSTVNWIIGNSWTSAINVNKLIDYMANHSLNFEPSVYVFPAGLIGWTKYAINTGTNPVQVVDLSAIPSQSIFMIRLLPGVQNGTFTLKKSDMSFHSGAAHNTLRSSSYHNEVLFRVSPENNPEIYDLTAVGLRPDASENTGDEDITKIYQSNSHVFQLYSIAKDNQKLAANVVPENTKSVPLCFKPGEHERQMIISASRLESIDQVWLEDKLERNIIDLKEQDTYSFLSTPGDDAERFVVHFLRANTSFESVQDNFLQCIYNNGEIILKGLLNEDMGSILSVTDMQGRVLVREKVLESPEMRISVTLPDGVYITHLQGARSLTVKFMKGGQK